MKKISFILSLFILAIALTYNACVKTNFQTVHETTLGNPMTPVSSELMLALCGVINRCNPQVTLDDCQMSLLPTSGFATPLGLAQTYNTMEAVTQAEQSGVLVGNLPAGSTCFDTINALSCSSPQVVAAYDPTQQNPFASTPNMIPSSSCDQVFSPGVNLEVPVEMTDVGVSSNTTATAFSRTRTTLNTADYDGTVTYSFEVVTSNTDTLSRAVSLVDSGGNVVAQIPVAANASVDTRYRTSFTPTLGASDYRIQTDATSSSGQLAVYEARILVKQTGATQTKIFIPLLGYYTQSPFNADDSTAAADVDAAGIYEQNGPHHYALWLKNNAAFSQLAAGNPWTFEAVLSSAGNGTGYASLFDSNTGLQITASEVSTASPTPTLVTSSFSDSATNFTNLDNIEVRLNNASSSSVYVYRAGLWVKLTNLTHAEVYYRYLRPEWKSFGSGVFNEGFQRVLIDLSAFTSSSVYHELSGYVSAAGTTCTESPSDVGTSDSGASGTLVTGSTLTLSSLTKTRQRTAPLTLTSGDRYISQMSANPGPGNCFIINPTIVVGF